MENSQQISDKAAMTSSLSTTSSRSRGPSASLDLVLPNIPSKCSWYLGAKPETSVHNHAKPAEKSKIFPNVLSAVGNTPLIRLNRIPAEFGIKCEMLAKCEFFNAGGSVKDRIGLRMIEDAEKKGLLKPGYTLIEPTSGNTGIAVALAAAVKGYKCTCVMPEQMSREKAEIMRALGAEIIRTPKGARFDTPESHIGVAQKVNMQIPNSVVLYQYRNPENPLAHYDTTAEEILYQCDNRVDMIVVGAGTGGTITGIGRKIKEKCPNCKIIGVDPYGSILAEPEILNQKCAGSSREVEGIGKDFVPTVLDRSIVDKWIKTGDKESFQMARMLIRKEGLLCGGSSGSAMTAAIQVAKDLNEGQRCVVLLPDGIRNYMSKFLSDSWLSLRDFIDINPEMSAMHWWCDLKVSSLKIPAAFTIMPHMSCQDAINIMRQEGYEQLPVVDDSGVMKGMVTLDNIMTKIMGGKAMSTSYVSDILYTEFYKITLEASLGQLSRILDKAHFAVINDLRQFVEKEKIETKQIAIGVVTRMDLISFITNQDPRRNSDSSSPAPTQDGTDEDDLPN